jgi:hypothetical protein
MRKNISLTIIFCTMAAACFTGCSSTGKNPSGMTSLLEGTWKNDAFKLVIKETSYLSLLNDKLYGMGQISYDGKYFILASTHAWRDDAWVPFEEIIKGECGVGGNILTISNVEGRYSAFNGAWEKIENINLENFIHTPSVPVRLAGVINYGTGNAAVACCCLH